MKQWVALFSLLCVFAAPATVFAAEAVFETASVTGRHAYQKSFYGSIGSSFDIYVQSDQPVSVHIFRMVHKSPHNGGSMWRDHKVAGSYLQTSHLLTVAVPVGTSARRTVPCTFLFPFRRRKT